MKFELGSPFRVPTLSHFPFAFTVDFDSGRIDDDVEILSDVPYPNEDREGFTSDVQSCVVGATTLRTKFLEHVRN